MTFPISAKCPCGFSAEGPDAAQLYREHTCPKPHASASSDWSIAAVFIAFIAAVVITIWIIAS